MAEQPNPKRSTAAPVTIDDLPIDLLIRILSLLPIFCAVITSLVCRSWRNLWRLIPILEFYLEEPAYRNHENHHKLANRITHLLLNRPKSDPVREFRLSIRYFTNHRHRHLISSWLRYAIDCGVEEIELCFYGEEEECYDFHLADIRNKPVRSLALNYCDVVLPSDRSIQFNSIRVLSITLVDILAESLTSLISMCGNLEKFNLDFGISDQSRKFKISSKCLKFVTLTGYFGGVSEHCKECSLEIYTPNLTSIEISDFYVDSYTGDLSSVEEAKLQFESNLDGAIMCWNNAMDLLRGVKSLKIQDPSPMIMYSKFEHDGFEFERLTHLELKTGYTFGDVIGLYALFKRCPTLEVLVLNFVHQEEGKKEDEEKVMCRLNKSKTYSFHIPSLKELKIRGFRSTVTEHLFVCLFMRQKFVPVSAIPVPETTCSRRARGFVHYLP